jgi:Tfp pilus assembly protein FimT
VKELLIVVAIMGALAGIAVAAHSQLPSDVEVVNYANQR